jgi:hypothetical protein
MNISANGKVLVTATRELSIRWSETKDSWRDAKADEFEQRFLVELLATVDRTAIIFDDLDKLISKVRNDCE